MNELRRRDFILTVSAAAVAAAAPTRTLPNETPDMYGLVGKITAEPGQRDALIDILLEGTADMPGCLSYIVAKDPVDADSIWVTEVWESQARHEASLSSPAVQQAMAEGRPLIAEFGERFETEPIGGHGLVSTDTQ